MTFISIEKLNGDIVKNDERYTVEDNTFLKDLVVSKTTLKPKQSTKGHFHNNIEEVYMCISGNGRIEVGENDGEREFSNIVPGDISLIKEGLFHRVYNDSEDTPLVFISIFQSYDRNSKSANYNEKQK